MKLNFFGKVIAQGTKAMGKSVVAGAPVIAHRAMGGTASLLGAAAILKDHPFLTTAGVVGLVGIGGYTSQSRQSIPAGPTTVGVPPASSGSNKYDLGATGDLVFALHRLRG